jgi:hypothetical protein
MNSPHDSSVLHNSFVVRQTLGGLFNFLERHRVNKGVSFPALMAFIFKGLPLVCFSSCVDLSDFSFDNFSIDISELSASFLRLWSLILLLCPLGLNFFIPMLHYSSFQEIISCLYATETIFEQLIIENRDTLLKLTAEIFFHRVESNRIVERLGFHHLLIFYQFGCFLSLFYSVLDLLARKYLGTVSSLSYRQLLCLSFGLLPFAVRQKGFVC